jgi:hypothetical protein
VFELDLSAEGAAVAAERYVAARTGLLPSREAMAFLDDLFDEHTEAMLEVASLRGQLEDVKEHLAFALGERDVALSERDSARAAASLQRTRL